MLPIYIGVDGEANQGLCTGSENYWCVNKNAAPEDIQATLDFINWCVTSDEGTNAMADDHGLRYPLQELPRSPPIPWWSLPMSDVRRAARPLWHWNFSTMPSEEWKNGVGTALTAYAADPSDANWSAVVTAFVDGWASEYQLANG